MIREMSESIEIDPSICGGQPVIKGTRIPVSAILKQLAYGESWDSLLHGYPELKRSDIQAALQYAQREGFDYTQWRQNLFDGKTADQIADLARAVKKPQ